jgi:hypothetical protein
MKSLCKEVSLLRRTICVIDLCPWIIQTGVSKGVGHVVQKSTPA